MTTSPDGPSGEGSEDQSSEEIETPDESPDGGRVFVSGDARRGAAVRLLALAVAVVGTTAGLLWGVPAVTDPAWVRSQVAGFGVLAPVALVGLQAAQVVFAPVPGQVIGGVAGYLFGTVGGTVLSMLGVLAGSALVFLVSQRFGRPYVQRVIDPGALARWDEFVDRRGTAGLFVLFLLPTFPDDLLCFVAGLSELRLRTFLVLVVVGRTPTFVAASYAGTHLADGRFLTFAGVVASLAAGSVAVYLVRDRLLDRMSALG